MTDDERYRHDFKNQLGVILGFAELLLGEAPVGDPRRADLEEICRAARNSLDLLKRLYPGQTAGQP